MIREFANGIDDDDDIVESFQEFCDFCELNEDDSEFLGYIIMESAERTDDGIRWVESADDDEENESDEEGDAVSYPNDVGVSEKKLRAFLKLLKTTPSPFQGILSNLKLSDREDPYGNKAVGKVKAFDRGQNRYGHNPEDDYKFDPQKAIAHGNTNLRTSLPSLPIQESILQPLDPRYLEGFNRQNFTMAGDLFQSDYSVNHADEWRETQTLINENKKRFGDNHISEHEAIRSEQRKGVSR